MTARVPELKRLTNRARMAHAEMVRWERRRDEASERVHAANVDLASMWQETCERFGRDDIPTDALLLDVLESIDVEAGDVWRWNGVRNNKGLATLRRGRNGTEVSLVRYLAESFGIVEPDEYGLLYPANGDPDDVNPWHRTLRRSQQPVGDGHRFTFRKPETAA